MRYVNHPHFIDANLDGAPDKENSGGGVHSKVWNIQRALPEMEIASELGSEINLIDPLWLNMFNTETLLQEKTELIKESDAINILWQEELAVFRFTRSEYRFTLFDNIKAIFNCNKYLNSLMKTYISPNAIPLSILYTPIDETFFTPSNAKRMQVVAMAKVGIQKNIHGIIDMFKALPSHIDKIYLGSVDLWGGDADDYEKYVNLDLQRQLKDVCDWQPSLNKEEVAEVLSESWGYVNMTKYDVGCLSFLEAAMSGCHCFCWNNHPMFDEYFGVNRFDGIEDGVQQIVGRHVVYDGEPDMDIRRSVMLKHSYEIVKENLKNIMGNLLV